MQIANNFTPVGFKRLIKNMDGATPKQVEDAEKLEQILTIKVGNKPTPVEHFESIGRDVVIIPEKFNDEESLWIYMQNKKNKKDSELVSYWPTGHKCLDEAPIQQQQQRIIDSGDEILSITNFKRNQEKALNKKLRSDALKDFAESALITAGMVSAIVSGTAIMNGTFGESATQDCTKNATPEVKIETVTDSTKTNQEMPKDTLVLKPEDLTDIK